MLSESLILQFLTLMQQYWKDDIPILYFGIIGSGLAFCASMVPALGKYCFKRFQFKTNFSICYLNLIIAYSLIALSIPYFGILPVILLYCTYQCIVYFNGCYIHDACEESFRATVLSVQSMLSFSKYGIISILYSFLSLLYPNLSFKIHSIKSLKKASLLFLAILPFQQSVHFLFIGFSLQKEADNF